MSKVSKGVTSNGRQEGGGGKWKVERGKRREGRKGEKEKGTLQKN